MLRNLLLNRENWDETALIDDFKKISYRDLALKAIAVQKKLIANQRENIVIFLPNGGYYIEALFGVLMAEMTAFPLNIKLTKYEIIPLLTQASVHTVITSEAFQPIFEDIVRDFADKLNVIYIERLEEGTLEIEHTTTDVDIEEPMLLISTSGTTGNVKLVQLSERNIQYCILSYLDKMDYEKIPKRDIRYVIATPFSSSYGLMILMACITKSFPIVLLSEAFTLDIFYRAVQEHRITHYEGGTSVAILMDQMSHITIPYDISSLRYLGLAGSKVPEETLRRLSVKFTDVEFWTGYGMTEASPLITKPYKKMDPEKFASVGTALKGETILVEINGVMTDMPYLKGEIVVKGPNVMMGYYRNKEETCKVIKNGYLYTGDIGYLDEDGYLYISGRKKNVIIVRGFNVYAEEVESCILNSNLAKECIVYGEVDCHGNEFVCADVVPITQQIKMDDIRLYCLQHLSNYKQPQRIHIIDKIGKTITGKNKK